MTYFHLKIQEAPDNSFKFPEAKSPIQVHPVTEIGSGSMKGPRPTLINQKTRNSKIGSITNEVNEEDLSELTTKRRFTEMPNAVKRDSFFNKFNTILK